MVMVMNADIDDAGPCDDSAAEESLSSSVTETVLTWGGNTLFTCL